MLTSLRYSAQPRFFRPLLLLALLLCTLCATAQLNGRIGYLSRTALLNALPETAAARAQVDSLRAQYQREADYNEQSFRRQFSEYLQTQKQLNQTLLLKRQGELQDAMERSLRFRRKAEELIRKAEADLMKIVEQQLDAAIRVVGEERGYLFIVNTDLPSHPYLNPALSEDATAFVRLKLGLK